VGNLHMATRATGAYDQPERGRGIPVREGYRMLRNWGLLGLTALTLTCLTGCPPRDSEGGGGGTAFYRPTGETDLSGDQRIFAEVYAQVPWVVSNLGAGDWPQALRKVTAMQDGIVRLKQSDTLRARPRLAIAGLQPKVDELALRLQRRSTTALPLAAEVADDFTRVAVELAEVGWLAAGWGGGAGRAVPAPSRP
jgi:hypothetical protein